MSKRMSLVEGLQRDKHVLDPAIEKSFLKHGKVDQPEEGTHNMIDLAEDDIINEPQVREPARRAEPKSQGRISRKPKPSKVQPVGLIPVTVRLRPEVAGALKRASLERQLTGEELFTQQEIVEQALEPWLRDEGYLG